MGIWVAPARARCGQNQTHSDPVLNLVSLIWDPGTELAGPLRQFTYVQPENPIVLLVVTASSTPGDASWDEPTELALTDGGTASFGTHLDSVAIDNNYFLLPGTSENYALFRGGEPLTQQLSRHGMPPCTIDLRISTDPTFAASAATVVDLGFYQYWFTWYSSDLDREGDRPDPPYIGQFGSVGTAANFVRFTASIPVAGATNRIFVRKEDFDNQKPPHADKIRLYRSITFDQDVVSTRTSPLSIPWPDGWMIKEIAISSLVVNAAASALYGDPYYALYGDTFEVPSNLIDRYSDETQPFPKVTVAGVQRGQNGLPPPASTGDTFEESLVLNDLNDPRKVRYSFPGFPHAFPDLHFINMDSKDSDEVVSIRTLGTRLFIGMKESIWKVNWLPLEGDETFSRGRVKDNVIEGKGVLGASAVTRFTLPRLIYAPDGTMYGTMIAWVSRDGVYTTDLDNTIKMTRGITWPVVEAAILIDNPEKERLECGLYTGERYTHPGAPDGVPDTWFYIHYSDGKIRTTGPVRRPGGIYAAAYMARPDGAYILSSDMDGKFAIESIGGSEPATGEAPQLHVITRDIYPEGFMEETEIGRGAIHATGEGSLSTILSLEGKGVNAISRKSDSLLSDPLILWPVNRKGERCKFEILATGNVRINFVGADDAGQELGEVER